MHRTSQPLVSLILQGVIISPQHFSRVRKDADKLHPLFVLAISHQILGSFLNPDLKEAKRFITNRR